MESDDEDADVASVDTTSRISAGIRRGGKRMDMIRPHLEAQQQQSVNDEDLYSESDQEADTQSRTSATQVCVYHYRMRVNRINVIRRCCSIVYTNLKEINPV